MNHNGFGRTAILLAGAIALTSSGITVNASTGISSLLPAAGMALTLEEGSSSDVVKTSQDSHSKDSKATSESTAESESKESKDAAQSRSESSESQEAATTSESESDAQSTSKPSATASLTTAIMSEVEAKEEAQEEPSEEPVSEDPEATAESEGQEAVQDSLTEEERSFSNLVIAKVTNYVNIRSTSSEEGEVVGKLYDKSVGEFIEEENGWYKIKSGSVTGFVKGEFCVTGEAAIELAKQVGTRVAVVNTTTLKVRNEASTDSAVLGLVPIEEELTVVEELDEWVKVDIEEGFGYVSKEFVNLRTDFVKAESVAEEKARLEKEEKARKEAEEATKRAQQKQKEKAASDNSKGSSAPKASQDVSAPVTSIQGSTMGQKVVNYAMQFVGNPYVYGGTSLTNGADCSGFVMSVYKNFGVSLPHSSSADRSQGYDVGGLANAQPGDLVCYSGHVGIYAGGGKIVHASTARTGITVSNANYRQVLAVRRIFQ